MNITFTIEQIKKLRKELRGLSLMQELEGVCERGRIAKRSTVYKSVSFLTYDDDNPVHRLVVMEGIKLVEEKGGDVECLSIENDVAQLEAA